MGRASLHLIDAGKKQLATDWIRKAPYGTRVDFKASKRSISQNSLMWACLTDIASQATHYGRKYTTDQWKCIFLHALGRETQFLPALEGSEFVPYGNSSSDLSKDEMSNLIDLIYAWGSENNIEFSGAQTSVAPKTAPPGPDVPTYSPAAGRGGGSLLSESPPSSGER